MKKYLRFLPVYLLAVLVLILVTWWTDRTVTVLSENAPLEERTCIVIDAGHGYPDGGAVSCTGVHECTINLEIAQRLDDLLHLLGFDTKMIRTDESSVYTAGETIGEKKVSDLKERVRIVNETENAILLSIHQNQYAESRYSGAQMFWGREGDSKELAEALQTAFVTHLNPGSSRQAKKAEGIYLMEQSACTAVLVECGFLSNPEEEAKLRTAEYQKKICCVIAVSMSNYLANT